MVQFKRGLSRLGFYLHYLTTIRWLFHGQFSGQDHWMVAETDAPPERLYRPDVSLIEWRNLFTERAAAEKPADEKKHRQPQEPTAPLEEPT